MNGPENKNTQMSPHGYMPEGDILGIRFSRANLGKVSERIGRDLRVMRTKQGHVAGIIIHNAAKKLRGIIDLDPKEELEAKKEQELKDQSLIDVGITLGAVEHYFPGVIGAARTLLATDVERIQEKIPDANGSWREKFSGEVEELADNIHFKGWLEGLDEENKSKVFHQFAKEAWNRLGRHHTPDGEEFLGNIDLD